MLKLGVGGFLWVFSLLKVSGLAGGRETWLWEGWASGGRDLSLGESSWVQDSSQMLKGVVRLREVALLMQFPGIHPILPATRGDGRVPTDRPWSTLGQEEVFIKVN